MASILSEKLQLALARTSREATAPVNQRLIDECITRIQPGPNLPDKSKPMLYIKQGQHAEDVDDGTARAEAEDAGLPSFLQSLPEYLKSLDKDIDALHKCDVDITVPGLKNGIVPHPHQLFAAVQIQAAANSAHRGRIIADGPGLGKTLETLCALALDTRAGDGPNVIVAPGSVCRQWESEVHKFFNDGFFRSILVLGDVLLSGPELFDYNLVITSYDHVSAELSREIRFEDRMAEWKQGRMAGIAPKRPEMPLLAGIYRISPIGRYLVLDEAHHIKSTASRLWGSIARLRKYFDACIMLSGTPLDNVWVDVLGLLLLVQGHQVDTLERIVRGFTAATTSKALYRDIRIGPQGHHMARIQQLLDAFILRRPATVIKDAISSYKMFKAEFDLDEEALAASNTAFLLYQEESKKPSGMKHKSSTKWNKAMNSAGKGKTKGAPGFDKLAKAQQYAYHPKLLEVAELELPVQGAIFEQQDADNVDRRIHRNARAQAQLLQWRQELEQGENWRSPRVDKIIEVILFHHRHRPDDAIVITDESLFFLDIIELAISRAITTPKALPCYKYTGQMGVSERHRSLQRFQQADGARVLLLSRGVGNVGLNIQAANVMIRCGPWWKESWETQMDARIHRMGQTKPVIVYMVHARGCLVEDYKSQVRDNKKLIIQEILEGRQGITRNHDEAPPKRVIV